MCRKENFVIQCHLMECGCKAGLQFNRSLRPTHGMQFRISIQPGACCFHDVKQYTSIVIGVNLISNNWTRRRQQTFLRNTVRYVSCYSFRFSRRGQVDRTLNQSIFLNSILLFLFHYVRWSERTSLSANHLVIENHHRTRHRRTPAHFATRSWLFSSADALSKHSLCINWSCKWIE